MPWALIGQWTDLELEALFLYLQSHPPWRPGPIAPRVRRLIGGRSASVPSFGVSVFGARSPAALRLSWSPHQVVGTPFLPAVTPEQRLPPGYARLAVLEAGIPDALNGSGPGARAWVDDGLRGLTADGFPEPGALPPRTLDRLLTCTTVLGHAYRWDRIPSPSRDFHLDHLDLPVALETVWRRAAAARGIPMVGPCGRFFSRTGA